jgi:hypothetical protein
MSAPRKATTQVATRHAEAAAKATRIAQSAASAWATRSISATVL